MAKRKRRNKNKGCGSFIIAFLLMIAVMVAVRFIPVFNITDIKVTGNTVLKSASIIETSGIKEGENLFRTSTGKAKKGLKKLPYVKGVKIKRILPSGIEIIIDEEKAAAYMAKGKEFVCINADGKVLQVSKEAPVGVMHMPGIKIAECVVGETIKYENMNYFDIQKKCIALLIESGLHEQTAILDISNSSSLKLTVANGMIAQVGTMAELDYKFKMINKVLEEGYTGGIFNIQNTAQPTYRKNK